MLDDEKNKFLCKTKYKIEKQIQTLCQLKQKREVCEELYWFVSNSRLRLILSNPQSFH